MADPEARPLFDGIEQADSFVVTRTSGCSRPTTAARWSTATPRAARHRTASAAPASTPSTTTWNLGLCAAPVTAGKGLPFWFSLAAYGERAYATAIRQTLDTAGDCRGHRRHRRPDLVLGPQLSVLLFRAVSHDAGALAAGPKPIAAPALFCACRPRHGETVLRICVVNPSTDPDEVLAVWDPSMSETAITSRACARTSAISPR